MCATQQDLKGVLEPDLLRAVYDLRFPRSKETQPQQKFYDLVFHRALMPLSKYALKDLLAVDMMAFLPPVDDHDFPMESLGLLTMLDQTRGFTSGYNSRYTKAFFDPIAEKLARQLISLPEDQRPDGKVAWLRSGYSVEEWLFRAIWFWAPLVHADAFMAHDRQVLKDWLHYMRAEIEAYTGTSDPYASLEDADDLDVTLFPKLVIAGPPKDSSDNKNTQGPTIADTMFWWIRILNSHFAIIDAYGRYPYWVRVTGKELTEKEEAFLTLTGSSVLVPVEKEVLQEIRSDFLRGEWRPLKTEAKYELFGT